MSDVEQKIKTIEQSGHADILNNYQAFRAKRTKVSQYETDVVNLKAQVETIINAVEIPTADASIFNNLIGNEQEVTTKINSLIQAASDFKENISKAITTIDTELANFKEWYCSSEFNQAHIAVDEKYNKLIENLQSQGVGSPADYSKLIGDREAINQSLKSMELINNQIVELTTSVNDSYQEIIECRKFYS